MIPGRDFPGKTALVLLTSLAVVISPALAFAHTGESGLVLLLPTDYYLLGGTLAVLASFCLIFLWPAARLERLCAASLPIGSLRVPSQTAISAIACLFLTALILSGLFGSRDPRSNPLPVTIWSVWWGSFVFVQAACGDLWYYLNPSIAPSRLVRSLLRRPAALLRYPGWLGHWPAILSFGFFSWLELVDLAPDDPTRLARFVLLYLGVTIAGMVLFGEDIWLARGDPFSFFLRLLAHLSPIDPRPMPADPARRRLFLVLPGSRLFHLPALTLSGTLFVLMTLSSVSFDGLSRTFRWLSLAGINPLEFPGRSAVLAFNTTGLFGVWLVVAAAYLGVIALGQLINPTWRLVRAAGLLVISIVPIALAYHFAHYLTILLMELQYVVQIYGDPLDRGWNPLGLQPNFVTASFLNDYHAVSIIWNLQAGAVVLGHLVAVAVAHVLNARLGGTGWRAVVAQVPLAILMVLYTLFGLWLLAAPNIG
ncbi:hypothetical protein [Dongia sp.]|jgi:hypothetical protein|uniref:hypothetical protein n=1 Tax=Dongia sp. TaxID=1977262 RepID=UPI0035B3ABC8